MLPAEDIRRLEHSYLFPGVCLGGGGCNCLVARTNLFDLIYLTENLALLHPDININCSVINNYCIMQK